MGRNLLTNGLTNISLPPKPTEVEIPKPLWKCLLTEFIGTFLLIFIGCGSGIKLRQSDPSNPLPGIALCWTFLIASLVQTLRHYSCDINPAVTISKLVTGQCTLIKAALYIVIQCIGCTTGTYILKLMMPLQANDNYGMTVIAPEISAVQGFFIEVLATFMLVFTVFAADDKGRNDMEGSIPLSVGICVGSLIIFAGPFTGTSLNPARTFGPCLVAREFKDHWVYWAGPICGGVIAALLYQTLFSHNNQREAALQRRDSVDEQEVESVPSAV